MLLQDFVDELHCPYCGSGFQQETQFFAAGSEASYGIIRCACYRYPIIEGIPILKHSSGPADTRDKLIDYLEAGDSESALHHALNRMSPIPLPRTTRLQGIFELLGCRSSSSFASMVSRFDRGPLIGRMGDGSLTFGQVLSLVRPASYAHYLFHRYANNSFLASIALLLLLKELNCDHRAPATPAFANGTDDNKATSCASSGRSRKKQQVLELACGVGHASFLMSTLFPHLSIIAADHDFVNLYIARRYLIPNVTCVCVDAEIPLPFADKSFDAVFCLDGLHYIRSKRALLSELDRVLDPLGLWLFPHLHNALAHNFSPGIPLAYEDYLRCFEFIQPRILSEEEVFRNFMNDQNLDLRVVPLAAPLRQANAFSLIGSRRTDLWHEHRDIASLLQHGPSPLTVNPIYRVTSRGKTILLKMEWPNARLEEECAPIKKFLPLEYEVEYSLWKRLTIGMNEGGDDLTVQKLINSFVLVRLPPQYNELSVQ